MSAFFFVLGWISFTPAVIMGTNSIHHTFDYISRDDLSLFEFKCEILMLSEFTCEILMLLFFLASYAVEWFEAVVL